MGSDIAVIMEKGGNEFDVANAPSVLNAFFCRLGLPDCACWTWGHSSSLDPDFGDWLTNALATGRLELNGPMGSTLYVRSFSVALVYCLHWDRYRDADARALAQSIHQGVASLFGSNSAVLIPDDEEPYADILELLITGNLSFKDALSRLLDHMPPKSQFDDTMIWNHDEAFGANTYEICGWFREECRPKVLNQTAATDPDSRS